MKLIWPYFHHVSAAEGWIGLGDYVEAADEIGNIPELLRAHPTVLLVLSQIYAYGQNWQACLDIGEALIDFNPELPERWLVCSSMMAKLGRPSAALAKLLQVIEKFPKDWRIRYFLACYACKLGLLKEARVWLGESFTLGDAASIKLMALDDPELEPIWSGA